MLGSRKLVVVLSYVHFMILNHYGLTFHAVVESVVVFGLNLYSYLFDLLWFNNRHWKITFIEN